MANPTFRNCQRSADFGVYCSSCAAKIMARALNLYSRGRRKRLPPAQRILPRLPVPTVSNIPGQQRLFR